MNFSSLNNLFIFQLYLKRKLFSGCFYFTYRVMVSEISLFEYLSEAQYQSFAMNY